MKVSWSVTGCPLGWCCSLWVSSTVSQGVAHHLKVCLWSSLECGWLSFLVILVVSWADAAVCAQPSRSLHWNHPPSQLAYSFSDGIKLMWQLRDRAGSQPEGSPRGSPQMIWSNFPLSASVEKTPCELSSSLQKLRTERMPLFSVPACPPRNAPWGQGKKGFYDQAEMDSACWLGVLG